MSRMTKFLKQSAVITYAQREADGSVKLDMYGDPLYNLGSAPVKCRRERATKNVLTTGGAAIMNTTKYYLDNSVNIELGDKIDGKVVQTVKDYINSVGESEGWEVTV